MRFKVEGDEPVQSCELDALVAYMQAYGVAAQEFVGKKDEHGKTPITFQVMISKEHFELLFPIATSKEPILPFSVNQKTVEQVPSKLLNLVKGYLGLRISNYTSNNQLVRIDNAKISVNEAPATRAISVRKQEENGRETILVGDAALGLSYFKGLNAGIENAAQLIPALCSNNPNDLKQYEEWFDCDLAPRKVAEVESYSRYKIRLPETIFNFFNALFGKQFLLGANEAENITESYVGYINNPIKNSPFTAFPHRDKPASPLFNLQPNPLNFLNETSKYFNDYGKAYKSPYHFLLDLAQPLRGIYHLVGSALKFVLALPILILKMITSLVNPGKHQTRLQSLNNAFRNFGKRLLEVGAEFILGVTLTIGLILYPLKLIARGLQTFIAYKKDNEYLLIENNKGIKRLVEQGEALPANSSEYNSTYNVLRVQLHRKYRNAIEKGQASNIDIYNEEVAFKKCRPDNRESYLEYLSLFKQENTRVNSDDKVATPEHQNSLTN